MMKTEITLHHKYKSLFRDLPNVRYVIMTGGRGSGKSFATSLYLANKFVTSKKNCLYLRQFMTNADSSTIPQFLAQVEILKLNKFFYVKHGEIQNNFGAKLYFKGIQTSMNSADSNLKSIPNLETILIEEATEIAEKDFDKLNLSVRDKDASPKIILALNPSDESHWIFRRFFKDPNIPFDFNGISGNTLYIHTTYLDNMDHLDDSFKLEAENVKRYNLLKYNNLFLGEWRSDNSRALWTQEMIDAAHNDISIPARYDDIVVGVDPAVSANKTSDATGIIVAGRKGNEYHIIDEKTGIYTPSQWANIVRDLYYRYNCSNVVVETNQGGDLCVENIRNVDNRILIKKVRASVGKIARAEPIAALYEQHLVKHLKYFSILEKEMLTFSGDPKDASPNSLDACVWALHFLSAKKMDHGGF